MESTKYTTETEGFEATLRPLRAAVKADAQQGDNKLEARIAELEARVARLEQKPTEALGREVARNIYDELRARGHLDARQVSPVANVQAQPQ